MSKKSIQTSFFLALGEVGYILLVAFFFRTMGKYFSDQPDPAPFAMVIILTLLVISAAVSGALILGKPVLMYLDGKKREAVELFAMTLGWLVAFFILFVLVLFWI